MKLSVASLLLSAAAAAPPTGNFTLCALYVNQTRSSFSYGRLSPSGAVHELMQLPGLFAVFDGAAAGAEEGTFYTYAGYGPPPQKSNGILEANFLKNTTVYQTIEMPATYPGNFYTPNLATDWSGADLAIVGTVQGIEGPDDKPTWTALSTVNPATGAATVRRNLTLAEEGYKWEKTGCAAFDSEGQVFYLIAGIGASEAETVLGYDSKGSPAIAIPFPSTYDAIALQYSVHFKALVALAYLRNSPSATFAWLVQDKSAPDGWKAAFTWPADTVYLSGMGETDIEDAGQIVAAAFTVPDGAKKERDIIAFVDLVSGTEIQRMNVTQKMVVADIEFCDAK